MDIEVPAIPTSYDAYRATLRTFIEANRPELGWKPRTGLRAPESETDVTILRRWVRTLYDAGYVPARFRLGAVDPYEARILEEELARTGIPYVLGNPLVAGALRSFATPEQRELHLDAIARGDHIWTQLFSEPDYGSDLSSLQTRARRDGDEFVIDGQKVWSTWAQWSDFGYLLARSEPEPGPKGITAFILDMRSPGVTTRPLREMTGTTDFNEVFLDGVRVPATNVIGAPGEGWKIAQASLAQERGGVAAGAGGGGPIADLVAIARSVARGGRPAFDDGGVRQDIARLAVRARIQRYLGYAVATRARQHATNASDAPVGKIWFSELNLDIAEYALELLGARGNVVEGDPLAWDDGRWQDLFLYARAWTIAGGSNEIMRNLIAERGLGLPREPRGS